MIQNNQKFISNQTGRGLWPPRVETEKRRSSLSATRNSFDSVRAALAAFDPSRPQSFYKLAKAVLALIKMLPEFINVLRSLAVANRELKTKDIDEEQTRAIAIKELEGVIKSIDDELASLPDEDAPQPPL